MKIKILGPSVYELALKMDDIYAHQSVKEANAELHLITLHCG